MALTRATDKIIANADGNLNLSGIVTATSFSGSGANLTGIDATAIKFGSDVKVQANNSGATVTGILTATKFVGQADISGGSIVGTSATFSGNVSIGGTLTYEDVTNIDSVGVVTARSGIKIGPTAGVAGTFFADGSYVTAGIITATSFSGSGANLTSLPSQATIANNADNRVITGGSGVNLNGEANLTFDGSNLGINGDLVGSNNTTLYSTNGGSGVRAGLSLSGSDQSIKFYTVNGGTERLRIDSSGRLLYGVTSSTRETSLILQGNSNSYTTNPGVLELRVGQVPSSASSLGSLVFGCTGDKIGATINAIADNADWSSGSSHPTAIRFFTTPASSTTQAERLRIDSDGHARFQHGLTGLVGGGVIVCAAKSSSGTANQSNYKVDFVVPMGDLGNKHEFEDIKGQFTSGQTGFDYSHALGGSGILIATVQNNYYWGYRTKIYHITTYGNSTNNVTSLNLLHNYSAAGHGGNSAAVDLTVQSHDGKTPTLRGTFSGDYWNSNVLTVTYIGSAVASTGNIRQLTTFDSKLTGQDPTWK